MTSQPQVTQLSLMEAGDRKDPANSVSLNAVLELPNVRQHVKTQRSSSLLHKYTESCVSV